MPGKHAKLSASSAHRWMACTASPGLEAQFPDTTSPYAAEGTEAHTWAERAAYARIYRPDEFFDVNGCDVAMLEAAVSYADLVRKRYQEAKTRCPDPLICLEERVDFSAWVPQGFGTADCLIIADGVLEVIDFKYGKGVRVSAEDNPQMMLYALGAWYFYEDLYDIQTVRMTIFQPRITDEPSTAEMTVFQLKDWASTVLQPKAEEAFNGLGKFCPGEKQCRFCRASAQCRARSEEMLALFDDADGMLEKVETLNDLHALLDPAEAAAILTRAQAFKDFLDCMETYVFACAANGDPTPGWKIVAGRSTRKISDAAAAGKALTAAGFPESLVWRRDLETLTALEKLVGKKKLPELLGDLITKPAGKPTLVCENDKRPALPTQKQMLDAFDE